VAATRAGVRAPFGRSLAAVSACMFGVQGVLAHWYAAAGGQTASLVALRFITGGVVFGGVAIALRFPIPRRPQLAGAVISGLGHVVFTTCLLRGFATSSVALTVLLFYTYPLFVTVGAAVLYGERLTPVRLGLVALGSAGVALAVGSPSGATPAGVLYGLGAAAACTFVVLTNRALLRGGMTVPQLAATAYAVPGACFLVLMLAGVIVLPPGTADAWAPALAYLGMTVTAFWLFYEAVSRIGASLASLLATLEPLVGVVLAWLLIGEPLDAGQIVGGALILTAVAALSLRGPASDEATEAIEAAR
jgi:drug/metabolite transporter (DMT)-like permease